MKKVALIFIWSCLSPPLGASNFHDLKALCFFIFLLVRNPKCFVDSSDQNPMRSIMACNMSENFSFWASSKDSQPASVSFSLSKYSPFSLASSIFFLPIQIFTFHLVKDEAKWMKSDESHGDEYFEPLWRIGWTGDVGGFSPVWVVAGVANFRQWVVFHTCSTSSTVVPAEKLLGWIKLHCNCSSWQECRLIQWRCHTQGYSWAHRITFSRISFWLGKSFRNRVVTSIGQNKIFRVCGHILCRPNR